MSYDIYIGEAIIERDKHYDLLDLTVNAVACKSAPCFVNDPFTKNGNHRHPGYGVWDEWCRIVGLHDLFFNKETGLMREHPGVFPLRAKHRQAVRRALRTYRKAHPDGVAGFGRGDVLRDADLRFVRIAGFGGDPLFGKVEGDPSIEYDPILARLVWLDWWVTWAIDNCELPAICNR